MRILLVEDDEQLADATARGLGHRGLAVDVAHDGERALDLAAVTSYDVVVLDRDLPKLHGDDVCAMLASSPARILMLTAMDTIDHRVEGFDLGADDYLVKPFALRELVARINALGRRNDATATATLTVGNIELAPNAFQVRRGGAELTLTPKEFGVLHTLMAAYPAPVSTEELLERVWDEFLDPFSNVVRVVMVTLRRKLGEPQPIETIKGIGYRITATT